MKKNSYLSFFFCVSLFFSPQTALAQMFYNTGSGFDSTGSSSYGGNSLRPSDNEEPQKEEHPFEKIVAKEIRERIRADAAYVIGEPDEAFCYGIARKSPKKRSATIDGYAHTGNCGSLNETGMTEVQNKLFKAESYDMNVTKIVSCVTIPKLALRFTKGFDFVDVILSGGNCPAVIFLYGGDTKEFSAKPIKDWLDTFIEAVSKDLEPLDAEDSKKSTALFRKKEVDEEKPATESAKPAAPKLWGRRVIRSEEQKEEPAPLESDPSVPPPPK